MLFKAKMNPPNQLATKEHVTLQWLHKQKTYLFLSRIPGIPLNEAWQEMDEDKKQYCVCKIVYIDALQVSSKNNLGMDCSTFVFSHNDLSPTNIIVDQKGVIGIIDWELAEYVPREWIRTKFGVSWGLDFE
ncbi:uncharacterized protein F4812DRAFT_131461 [Daldinia caldariorum]|uniref:uncharacterized protein n=1 Tax=Daldinia caldariorum TaxID=326644 RepID=UPI0020088AEE|nr:uncharacterized protein F4812DRAFT_131461 [Daldinia caldariorum]KAI1465096.1 hypothetical protein F4812DRAFT_131461 [Daldinia caldariorum]